MTGDRVVKPLSNDERAELRRRAIERKRRRDAAIRNPRGPRPPDGGEPMPVERAA